MRILGAIIAGGRSRRFGSDKAAFNLDGKPLLEHVADQLRPHVASICIAGRNWPGFVCVDDRPAGDLGPLGGLCGALFHAAQKGFDGVLTAGCDTLPVPVAILPRGDLPSFIRGQPLIGWWPIRFAPLLENWLATSEHRAVYGWVAAADAIECVSDVPVCNINTAKDLSDLPVGGTDQA